MYKISKKLSYMLRHNPQEFGIELQAGAWANVNDVLKALGVGFHLLEDVVNSDNKKRYSFNSDRTLIRANQGHSISVDLQLEPVTPPDTLYHGTVKNVLSLILDSGLKKMARHHVHLSSDLDTAKLVASRRKSENVLLSIDSKSMFDDGFVFFLSENGVWLTDNVPSKYISVLSL